MACSPSNINSNTSPSLAHLVRATRTHWCPPLLPPLPLSSQSQLMPNWARLVMASVITAVGKGIWHETAPRKAQVPNVVVDCNNAAKSEWLKHQNCSLKKGSTMMRKERARPRRQKRKCSLTGSSRLGLTDGENWTRKTWQSTGFLNSTSAITPSAMDLLYNFSHVYDSEIPKCTILLMPNFQIIGRLEEGEQAIVLDLIAELADSRWRF
jgi:hypothetical protein